MRKLIVLLLLFSSTAVLYGQEQRHEWAVIDSILISGNKKTLRPIILRELEFSSGDILPVNKLRKLMQSSKENLLNTELFNFVSIKRFNTSATHTIIQIDLTEQWYSWVFPIFEIVDRNFNTWWETKDFTRADYGLLFIQENFRGRREEINIKVIDGYNEYLNFKYRIPYIDKQKKLGMMVEGEFLRSRETAVLTRDDELVFFKDEAKYPIKKNVGKLTMLYRNKFRRNHLLSLAYKDFDFMDTIADINPDFLMGEHTRTSFLSLSYEYERDFRDYTSYPLSGHYINILLEKEGLGLIDNLVDFWNLKAYFANYWKLNNRWFASAGLTVLASDESKQPYFLNNGLGYNKNFVRSYEYNVINGNHYGLLRTNMKFALVPPKTLVLGFIPWEQFNKLFYAIYLNGFVDAGYVDPIHRWKSNGNHLPGKVLIGKGVGIDFVTYYEKVFRLEYSWDRNNNGGFFIHFVAPI